MEGDFIVPQYYNKLRVFEEEMQASFMVRLEEKSTLEWPFEFTTMAINVGSAEDGGFE